MAHRLAFSLLLPLLHSVGCGGSAEPGDTDGQDDADPNDTPIELTIEPAQAEVMVRDGVPIQQVYTATAHFQDDSTRDVTDEVVFSVDDSQLGGFSADTFAASGPSGGRTLVRAVLGAVEGQAELTVRIEQTRVDPSAPDDARALFEDASEDASLAPDIVYPMNDTIVPPNLDDLETHWTNPADSDNDLFELRLAGDFADLRVYLTGQAAGAGRWAAFLPSEWASAGESERGGTLVLTVRGLEIASPGAAGTSLPIRIELTEQDVAGGIYYWASTGTRPSGIYRHDMANPGEPATPFYTTDEAPDGRCASCHVVSRDGTRLAVTFDGGDGAASVLDVATREPLLPTDGPARWNFAAFTPDGGRLLTVYQGQMSLRDAAGAILSSVSSDGDATHPDFSPAGDELVYVSVGEPDQDHRFGGGSLVLRPFDPVTDTFGTPTTLVAASGGNVYYPSWSPDGRWILFNRSNGNAYDEASAQLYVVRADGSAPPILLDSPNVASGLTNSWARWAPFEQTRDPAGAAQEPFFWLTFSSRRAFGVRVEGLPQLWMAPFFPERAEDGDDPSAPAFRLPFQDIATDNHIAQWTERIVGDPG